MKDKPNEWVSISDLMAGVMAVVMLLLVMSVLQKTYADLKHKKEMEESSVTQKSKVSAILTDLKSSLNKQGTADLVSFDIEAGRITLKDNVFERGSACITAEAKTAIASVEERIAKYLTEVKGAQVFINGHTDNIPVSKPVTDFSHFCTVYDDNFTLSAARAREARKLLIGRLAEEKAKDIIVAGYGDSQPLKGIPHSDAKNRRVEINFAFKGLEP
ncbi:OmpA/MotB family protein [Iodobacter fluviatilis]|uniref:Chemotaxis protein MotB n=1 Tax=Iodobacter fluviatilis TaxID=537 RepID=A0A377Q5T8_9NEIS|nr:OmpA family protein [Iodobacter fluviatilis]TCU90174.1 chemotaxis protein MotB [Iodobacter fluviatilis]STQ89201.1 Uncharacterized protein conserved in bacteria [Iodobacter fluviatilis]